MILTPEQFKTTLRDQEDFDSIEEHDAELRELCKEVCICAAIRMPNGEIIHGHRHNNCYDVVRARTDISRDEIVQAEQGFVTNRRRFVDRKEGLVIQRASGLPSHYGKSRQYLGDSLFSEDLYPNGPVDSEVSR